MSQSSGPFGQLFSSMFGGANPATPTAQIDQSGAQNWLSQQGTNNSINQAQAMQLAAAQGKGPSAATDLLKNQTQNAMAASNALASSGSGNVGAGAARRQAMMQGGNALQNLGGQAAAQRSAEQLGAMNQYGQMAQNQRGMDIQSANLMGQMATSQAQDQTQQNIANMQAAQAQASGGSSMFSGLMNAAATAAPYAAMMSDERSKEEIDFKPAHHKFADAQFQEPGNPRNGFTLREEPFGLLGVNHNDGTYGKVPLLPLSPKEERQAFDRPHGAGPIDSPHRIRTVVNDMDVGPVSFGPSVESSRAPDYDSYMASQRGLGLLHEPNSADPRYEDSYGSPFMGQRNDASRFKPELNDHDRWRIGQGMAPESRSQFPGYRSGSDMKGDESLEDYMRRSSTPHADQAAFYGTSDPNALSRQEGRYVTEASGAPNSSSPNSEEDWGRANSLFQSFDQANKSSIPKWEPPDGVKSSEEDDQQKKPGQTQAQHPFDFSGYSNVRITSDSRKKDEVGGNAPYSQWPAKDEGISGGSDSIWSDANAKQEAYDQGASDGMHRLKNALGALSAPEGFSIEAPGIGYAVDFHDMPVLPGRAIREAGNRMLDRLLPKKEPSPPPPSPQPGDPEFVGPVDSRPQEEPGPPPESAMVSDENKKQEVSHDGQPWGPGHEMPRRAYADVGPEPAHNNNEGATKPHVGDTPDPAAVYGEVSPGGQQTVGSGHFARDPHPMAAVPATMPMGGPANHNPPPLADMDLKKQNFELNGDGSNAMGANPGTAGITSDETKKVEVNKVGENVKRLGEKDPKANRTQESSNTGDAGGKEQAEAKRGDKPTERKEHNSQKQPSKKDDSAAGATPKKSEGRDPYGAKSLSSDGKEWYDEFYKKDTVVPQSAGQQWGRPGMSNTIHAADMDFWGGPPSWAPNASIDKRNIMMRDYVENGPQSQEDWSRGYGAQMAGGRMMDGAMHGAAQGAGAPRHDLEFSAPPPGTPRGYPQANPAPYHRGSGGLEFSPPSSPVPQGYPQANPAAAPGGHDRWATSFTRHFPHDDKFDQSYLNPGPTLAERAGSAMGQFRGSMGQSMKQMEMPNMQAMREQPGKMGGLAAAKAASKVSPAIAFLRKKADSRGY